MSANDLQRALAQGIGAQVTAGDPEGSVWVSANAGTGKTRVLVNRISRLLLAGTPAHRILCLTFTKAAAAEMANRLNERLGDWAATDAPDLEEKLHALFGRPANAEEVARARLLFTQTVESPEGLRIRTIHSFCESLLGRFPLESGLAPHFTVIDERRAAELREDARDRILGRAAAGSDAAVGEALDHLAGLVDEEGFASVMAELDAGRHKLHALMAEHGSLERLLRAGRKRLGLRDGDTSLSVVAAACTEDAFDRAALTHAAEVLAGGTKTDKERSAKLSRWLAAETEARRATFLDGHARVFLKSGNERRAVSQLMTSKPAAAHPGAQQAMIDEQDRVFVVTEKLKAIAVAENTGALLVVGAALLRAYEELKVARALVDYDDLIEKASALLASSDGVSWVHFKLDGGIDHILVDEAQDTSPVQWTVIEGLAGDFFSGAGRPVEMPRTMFAVGDEKQSIYSFQGADPARFGATGERLAARARQVGQPWNRVEMALSWRSAPAVLRAVDAVFGREAAADGLTWDGHPVRHQWSRGGEAGLVELWPTEKPSALADEDPWDAPLDQVSAESPHARLAARIADTVAGWLGGGEKLQSLGRPMEAGDIMVLVRTRGGFAEEIVRALKDRDIPVAGRDRMVLTDQLAVMDLIAAGRFALLPDDDLNTATVLKGPFVEMDEERLFDLAHGRAGRLWAETARRRAENPAFTRAHERLARLLAGADLMAPYEFFNALLIDGGRESLLAHLGPEAADPIDEFMAMTLDFESDHVPSLEGFLHWVGHGETEIKRDLEQSGGEVRVMTVHGAKGLQARVVFLADTCGLPAPQLANRIRWRDGDAEGEGFVLWPAFKEYEAPVTAAIADAERAATEREYRRLLYVAMTRAEDRLYVCGWQGKRELDDGCWYRLVEEGLKTLADTEAIETEDGDIRLRLASPQTVPPKQAEMALPLAGGDAAVPDWARRAPPREPTPTQPLSPSRQDDDPPVRSPLMDDDQDRYQRGRLVHALLQTLPELPADERREAARRFLAMPGHGLEREQQEAIALETLAILDLPAFAPLFGPGSRAEVPMVGMLDAGADAEPMVVAGQVDRLLVADDEVVVVDYKTNRPPPQREDQVAPVYLRQMAAYRALLRRIYPGRPVRAALLWTDGPRLMALSDEGLDAHAP